MPSARLLVLTKKNARSLKNIYASALGFSICDCTDYKAIPRANFQTGFSRPRPVARSFRRLLSRRTSTPAKVGSCWRRETGRNAPARLPRRALRNPVRLRGWLYRVHKNRLRPLKSMVGKGFNPNEQLIELARACCECPGGTVRSVRPYGTCLQPFRIDLLIGLTPMRN